MSVFSHKEFDQHEQVSFFHDAQSGLRAIIAVHNTHLGPSLGGCRMWAYENDDMALNDVLRLSRGMTYKAAISGVPLGGGKSVIIGDSRKIKTADLMRAMGRAVDTFGGRYTIAEDVGTTVEDMVHMQSQTKYVVGISNGGHGSGDPSPTTAYGVYVGLKAAAKVRLGTTDLKDMRVAVQGLGNVGYNLCRQLAKDGVKLIVTDVQADRVEQAVSEFGATPIALSDIYGADAEIFAPCALGAVLNDESIGHFKFKVVAGAANNQLAELRHGDVLKDLHILYAPDYVINAGGLINVYYENVARTSGKAYDRNQVMTHVEKISEMVESIAKRAEQDGVSTAVAADRIAEQRFKPAAAKAA